MAHQINWFEIPATDFQRATKFYSEILGCEMYAQKMGECDMAFFPSDRESVSGAVVAHKDAKPSKDGVLVYLNGGDDLNNILNRVESAGGSVELPKTLINEEIGYFARFIDSEGNLVALHSRK